jgi:hypothetical protein
MDNLSKNISLVNKIDIIDESPYKSIYNGKCLGIITNTFREKHVNYSEDSESIPIKTTSSRNTFVLEE